MFTGIIEDVGEVLAAERGSGVLLVRIRGERALRDLPEGGSIAVDGCCLTAIRRDADSFACELTDETLARTRFDERLKPGVLVNLERPLPAQGRLDGHIVQGHVDGVGFIESLERQGAAAELVVAFPEELGRYLVMKGSVAVDGISLTVAGLGEATFCVALIPYTLEHTNLKAARAGDPVNIEADVVAKYVERLMEPHVAAAEGRG